MSACLDTQTSKMREIIQRIIQKSRLLDKCSDESIIVSFIICEIYVRFNAIFTFV